MRVIFKNVGQGDSIILKWIHQGVNKIGIIDCNKFSSYNPTLEYIRSESVEKISFIVISHPHYDHYSGFRELLQYCEDEDIHIDNFLITCYQDIVYLKSAVKSARASNELAHLLKKVHVLRREKELIKHLWHLNSDTKILKLNAEINFETLAPTTSELEYFVEKKYSDAEENQDSQPFGNWLSTIIKIYGNNWYMLFTSDAEQSVIKKIGHEKKDKLDSNLILCQAPHHGSLKNHSSEFWRNLERKNPKVVFSVGKNPYGHPNKKVVQKFEDYRYEIYSTNKVGALSGQIKRENEVTEKLLQNIGIVDSQKEIQSIGSKDLHFEIVDGSAKYITK